MRTIAVYWSRLRKNGDIIGVTAKRQSIYKPKKYHLTKRFIKQQLRRTKFKKIACCALNLAKPFIYGNVGEVKFDDGSVHKEISAMICGKDKKQTSKKIGEVSFSFFLSFFLFRHHCASIFQRYQRYQATKRFAKSWFGARHHQRIHWLWLCIRI